MLRKGNVNVLWYWNSLFENRSGLYLVFCYDNKGGVYVFKWVMFLYRFFEFCCYVNIFKVGWWLIKKVLLNFDFMNLDWYLVKWSKSKNEVLI